MPKLKIEMWKEKKSILSVRFTASILYTKTKVSSNRVRRVDCYVFAFLDEKP